MIEFIISILVPILGGLGVSEADVTTYVTNCSGYIYAIFISILVLIVLLVVAHFIAPKGKRHLVRWGASLAWILALVTMVNMVCYCSCAKFLTQILIFFDTNFSAFSGSILRKLICIFCVKINKNLYIKQHIFYNYFRYRNRQ